MCLSEFMILKIKMIMKNFIPLNNLIEQIKYKKFGSWIDKITFLNIFVIWTTVIVIFGIVYYLSSGNSSFLYYSNNKEKVISLIDNVYFSFVAATTAGFGDIVPSGFFKIITITELIFGLLLLAFVTSKLVSIKQDAILNELYETSFNEKIYKIRSSLLLFRQNISKIINKIEEKTIRKREINEIYTYLSFLEDILNEIKLQMEKSPDNSFTKVIDPLNIELIFNSIINSFEKLFELISSLEQNKLEWKRDITIQLIDKCISINKSLFERLNSEKLIEEKSDFNSQNKKIIDLLEKSINQ